MFLVYLVYNHYIYGDSSVFLIFILSLDTPNEVHLLIFYLYLQEIRHFTLFYLLSS